MQNYNLKFKIFQVVNYKLSTVILNFKLCIFNSHNKQSGFSLIEILVSATLIGLLSTIGFTGFQAVTRSGRDALRKSDLEQIRSALEIYKSENGAYPANSAECESEYLSSDYINPYPDDPKPPLRYCYVRGATELSYELCARLENGNELDQFCGSIDLCGYNCNYQVTNP